MRLGSVISATPGKNRRGIQNINRTPMPARAIVTAKMLLAAARPIVRAWRRGEHAIPPPCRGKQGGVAQWPPLRYPIEIKQLADGNGRATAPIVPSL